MSPALVGALFATLWAAPVAAAAGGLGDIEGAESRGPSLHRLRVALDHLQAGDRDRVAVGVFGASHVERQRLTDRVRRRLQRQFGARGRGFIDPSDRRTLLRPGRIARRVRGPHLVQTGHSPLEEAPVLSPSGHRLVLYPGARAEIDTCARCGRSANDEPGTVELVWWEEAETAPAVVLVNDVEVGRIAPAPSAQGLGEASGEVRSVRVPVRGRRHRLEVVVGGDSSKGRVILLGAVFERERGGVVVDALGLSGSTGGQLGRWHRPALVDQVARRAYDLVGFAWGTNDVLRRRDEARYAEALGRSMQAVLDASPGADCLYVGPTDRQRARGGTWRTPPGYGVVERVQRALAAEHGCAYLDARRFMGGRGSVARWVDRGLAKDDRTHLTARGYRRLADRIVDEVLVHAAQRGRAQARLAGRGR